ncbi:MAG TPA: histidine--tRNA ligase [Firmicutes bacterium]|nr:histidine--tRNA ligase [Candidatus Fermentithermobacillaceae bacterium]
MLKSPRGTADILPPESAKWIYLEGIVREVARRYNFDEIRLPTFEHSELFSRTVGETTDIVEKEMYTFKDKTGRDLTLRPEGTAGVARAFLEHGMASGPLPRKLYYLGSMFRYERPQAGRYREHRQFGVEVFGSASPQTDVEVITLAMDIAEELGLTGTELVLNSIGCPKCRGAYREALIAYLSPHIDELCDDCRSRLNRNPLRALDCKNERCKTLVAGAPSSLDYLCGECREHWDRLREILSSVGIRYSVDKSLVRGIDYYTRTVFELKWPPLGSAGSTVCGGGRYDGLIEQLGGPPMPGVGFGMGLERMLLANEKGEKPIKAGGEIDVFIVSPKAGEGQEDDLKRETHLLELARSFRRKGLVCDFDPLQRSMKAQMKQADRMNARFVVILGEDEFRSGSAAVRSMRDGWQKTVPLGEVLAVIEEAGQNG